ncbi:hypothetical protein A4D02_18240 [Niastella koreensis]|uniref:Ig-like domain-containing protein n=2 Tax=Niastella koreensis TaxID=354356 RepID=G8TA99_NIAKG|nr:T9SS C-terminal target domain-containing protein [Niastella koreensis]AEV97046.1 hypothetical protein Niako_0662 [Niastella koreensis GR20-10]OQP39263.1 hypothetical protein A4D02_18240 [Niastella koreensis]
MFSFRTPPVLYLLLFLLSANCSFAVIRYVNINNPTPGAGTSWATAYNDLNLALAASTFPAHYGDTIWVAQGTYKPTTTNNRSATFLCTFGYSVYGGFNGTETAFSQRNPKVNVTILSGDIGITGSASDNSYHVVTLQGFQGGRDFDGFTIRDGNANAGYPGSTTQQPDNSGGGILELALASDISYADLSNDIITNNFAVYGGGFCSYGDGTSAQSFFHLTRLLFNNNTALFGGAVGAVTMNNDWGMPDMQNCIFTNNNSLTGQGSVFANLADNPYTGGVSSTMDNCTLYDNPAPVVFNQPVGAAVSNVRLTNIIIWKSGAAYPGPLDAGPSIFYSYCDLDLVTPPVSGNANIDADPLFVNAAGNDFHLMPCSPAVDKGYPVFQLTTDYESNIRPQGAAMDMGAYETAGGGAAAAPTATSPSYCQNATATALTATGSNLQWYTVAANGAGSATAPVPSTASAGTTTWYVTQTPAGSCESTRTPVTVTIKSASAAPTATSPTYCQNATATALTATGSNLQWYTVAINGTGNATAPVPSTASAGTTTWYVTQTPAGSCESARTPVTVTIQGIAAAPTATSPSYCQNTTATALTATGSNLQWYTVAVNGTGSSIAPVPSTSSAGTATWYVSQTPAGSCESSRTPIVVTVGSTAAAPTATSPTYCQNATATALTATGSNLQWYTVAINGTGNSTAPVPSTASAGTTTWYVTQTPAGSCESARTPVTVTVGSAAAAPTATSPTYCQNTTATALTATGSNLQWYTVAVNGIGSTTAPVPSTTAAGTTTWYVSQTPTGSCESARTPITVTINGQPAAPTATASAYCQNDAAVVLTATGTNLLWYTVATGGTGNGAAPTPSTAAAGTINYYVSQTSGCESSRTLVTITVNALPQVSISPVNGPLCVGGSATLTANGAATYQWNPATGLSDAASSNPVVTLKTDVQYTVTGTDNNGCIATAQISLKPSIACTGYNVPDAFTPNGDGHNDIFRVATADVPQSFHMIIFNRYGGKVFETSDVQAGWNGYMGSSPAMSGAYVYTIAIKTSTGTVIEKKGTVLVIR